MSTRSALRINAVELARSPGASRHVVAAVPLDELPVDDPRLAGDVAVDVTLESTLDDIVVTGSLTVDWSDECRRCLRPLAQALRIDVHERYAEAGADGPPVDRDDLEVFPIVNGQIDLRPMVREEVLLAVPDAPLCRDDCPGLCPVCGADLSKTTCDCQPSTRDERWAALDQLRDL